MDLREAAELAIEALQSARSVFNGEGDEIGGCGWCHAPSYGPCEPHCDKDRAVKALRTALAEDAMQRLTDVQQEIENDSFDKQPASGIHLGVSNGADRDVEAMTDVQQEMDCYGDGNVYRGQRSSDSKTQTLTINGMPAVEGPLSKAHRTCQESRQVEPVAFMHKNFERRIREVLTEADFGGDKLAFLKYCMSDGNLLPLYTTAPPKREPLSFAGVKITEVRLPKNMAMRFDGDVLVIERTRGNK